MSNILKEGEQAPDFKLPSTDSKSLSLGDYKGKKLVLYFYPKDDTPGCTVEAKEFTSKLKVFAAANCKIVGISKDTLQSHEKFSNKFCLPFPLVSDAEGTMCEEYGVYIQKSMFGKKYMGIERTTFLVDENGIIKKVWRNVSVPGHVDEVLQEVTTNTN